MPHQCTGCGHAFEDGSKAMLGGCPDCGGNTFQFYPEGTEVPERPPEDAEPPDPPEPEGSAVASKVGRATTKVRDFVSSGAPEADEPSPPSEPDAATPADRDSAAAASTGGDPDPTAPWPDSSDAADPIRKGGFEEGEAPDEDPHVSTGESGDGDIIDADARATERALEDAEDVAQADARSGTVSESEVEAAAEAAETEATDAAIDDGGDEPAVGASTDSAAAESNERSAVPGGGPRPDDGQVVREPTGEEPDLAELREQLNDQFESIKVLEPGQYELNLMELYDREEYIIALQENGRYVIQVPENFMGERPDA